MAHTIRGGYGILEGGRQIQGTHCTGKTGKMEKKSLSGKTQGIWKFCQNMGKTQGIWFAQVVNSLILKVKDSLIFAAKIANFILNWISQFCVCWHRKNLQSDRENTGI